MALAESFQFNAVADEKYAMREQFVIDNYTIDLVYHGHKIEIRVENSRDDSCYKKVILVETLQKMNHSQTTNLRDLKSTFTFFVKCFQKEPNYNLTLHQTPVYIGTVKDRNEMIAKFSATLDGFYEVYAHFQMDEQIFSFEEKMTRMMEKMKSAYESKIAFLEEKIEHMMKRERSASSSSMTSMMNEKSVSVPVHVPNIVIKKEKEKDEEVRVNQNAIVQSNDAYYFYSCTPAAQEERKKGVEVKEVKRFGKDVYEKKQFLYRYDALFEGSRYYSSYQEFLHNPSEEFIYAFESVYLNFYITNYGKLFLIHNYGGLSETLGVHNYAQLRASDALIQHVEQFVGSKILKSGSEKTTIIEFYRNVDLFLDELRKKCKY